MTLFWTREVLEVDYGPVSMRIRAVRDGRLHTVGAIAAGRRAEQALEELSRFRSVASQPVSSLASAKDVPRVLRLMMEAVYQCEDSTLTPMAAVAGSMAQVALAAAVEAGAGTVIVENGGDIAVAVGEGDMVRIGVAKSLADRHITHVIAVTAAAGIGGVCTSGMGGRSLTQGIAESATVAAETAGLADACATIVANAVYAEDPAIERCRAAELDPDTDIPALFVTCHVGPLSDATLDGALIAGAMKVHNLLEKGAIKGAIIGVNGRKKAVIPRGVALPFDQARLTCPPEIGPPQGHGFWTEEGGADHAPEALSP